MFALASWRQSRLFGSEAGYLKTGITVLTGVLLIASLGLLGAGAFAGEGALHPRRIPVAPVCPCIAHMSCDDATVTAPDLTILRAWYYRPEHPTGAAIILLHGVGANRTDMVGLGYMFLKAGYSVLEPDLRGHGESGGFTTYGVLEEQDVHAWADWMLARPGISRIYGFGASLGGSVLLESLNRESRFRGVVAESAYADFPAIANERIRRVTPAGARWLTPLMVDSGLAWSRLRYGVNLSHASATRAVRQSHTPVFLIHGLDDYLTAPVNSRLIAAANPATELWLVAGGGHADIWRTTGKEFETRVLGWLAAR
jgi:pimeloyl-ACP methyl ester carboxylesterase